MKERSSMSSFSGLKARITVRRFKSDGLDSQCQRHLGFPKTFRSEQRPRFDELSWVHFESRQHSRNGHQTLVSSVRIDASRALTRNRSSARVSRTSAQRRRIFFFKKWIMSWLLSRERSESRKVHVGVILISRTERSVITRATDKYRFPDLKLIIFETTVKERTTHKDRASNDKFPERSKTTVIRRQDVATVRDDATAMSSSCFFIKCFS